MRMREVHDSGLGRRGIIVHAVLCALPWVGPVGKCRGGCSKAFPDPEIRRTFIN